METGVIPSLNEPAICIVSNAQTEAEKLQLLIPHALTAKPIRIIENSNPFRLDQCREVFLEPFSNESVAAISVRAGFRPEDYECSLNGEPVSAGEIWNTPVKPGQEIILFTRAAGGNFGKEVLSLLIIAGAGAAGFILFGPIGLTLGLAAGAMIASWALAPSAPKTQWSTTYDPTGPKGLAQPGVPIPKGYGTMGWCGNVVSSYINFDGQDAYINMLVCFGWGLAKSLAKPMLNLQPIANYANCSYQTRLGTNTQTPIDGFDKTVNGYPQEIELLVANGSVIVQGTGTNIQGLDITLKFPGGLYRVTADGNYVPLKFIYKIEVAQHGTNSWVSPLFPNETETIAITHSDGTQTWPNWVVIPTDRYAGSGIVYDEDVSGTDHKPGDRWTGTQTVSVVNMDSSTGETTATFQGEWQPCDPDQNQVRVLSWWEGYRVVKNDTLSAFFDTVSIYGLTAAQWDVRVTKIGYCRDNNDDVIYADSNSAQLVSDGWLWNINESFWSNLSYPNMILLGVKALATSQLNGGSLNIMATIVHDIGADTVIPEELSTFEHDNPAIVAYDVLTNPTYGMGVTPSLIDVPSFVAWATFNDELVSNQDGTQARRHIFAGVFDQSGDAWNTLQTIGNMSRASIVPIGMRYTVVIDAPADPVQLFTIGNTKKDSFQEMWIGLDDRCTLIECDFSDADRTYRMDLPVSVMTEADVNSGLQPKITRTRLIGCTSRDQAWRWAYFQLMSTKLTLRSVQFTALIEAVCCQRGSVIGLQSDVTRWAAGGRVQAGSTLTTLNVDRTDLVFDRASGWTVTVQHPVVMRGVATVSSIAGLVVTMTEALPNGRILKAVGQDGTEYVVTGYAGNFITVATLMPQAAAVPMAAGQVLTLYDVNVIDNQDVTGITVTSAGSVLSVASPFSAVPSTDSPWAYGQSAGAQPAKLFRVVSIKKSGDFSFEIGALEYNEELYMDVTPNYGEIVGVPDTTPFITNLTVTEQYQSGTLTGSINSSVIAVGWQNGNTAVGAQVQISAGNGGAWKNLGNIQGQGCTFVGTIGTTYNVKVTGFDWQGNLLGSPATASITVLASSNAPANVTGFAGTFTAATAPAVGGSISFAWTAVTGATSYEIRSAEMNWQLTDWNDASPWMSFTGTSSTVHLVVAPGTGPILFLIKATGPLASGGVQSVAAALWTFPGC